VAPSGKRLTQTHPRSLPLAKVFTLGASRYSGYRTCSFPVLSGDGRSKHSRIPAISPAHENDPDRGSSPGSVNDGPYSVAPNRQMEGYGFNQSFPVSGGSDNGSALLITADADQRWGDTSSPTSPTWILNGWTHCVTGVDFEVVDDSPLMISSDSAAVVVQ